MLVLSRKVGEKIRIGDDVWITLVDIDRNKVRLGITAPRQVPVYREELLPLNPQKESERVQGVQGPQVPVQEVPPAEVPPVGRPVG